MNRKDNIVELYSTHGPYKIALSEAISILMGSGALDAFIVDTPSQYDHQLHVLCHSSHMAKMAGILHDITDTEILQQTHTREVLSRSIESAMTPLGSAKRKTASYKELSRTKWEFEDLKRLSDENDLSIREVRSIISNENKC